MCTCSNLPPTNIVEPISANEVTRMFVVGNESLSRLMRATPAASGSVRSDTIGSAANGSAGSPASGIGLAASAPPVAIAADAARPSATSVRAGAVHLMA